jgi:hypothetical protein
MILYFDIGAGEWSVAGELSALTEKLLWMANRGLLACVAVVNVGLNTHRSHGSCFSPRITITCALEVIAAPKFSYPDLQVPRGSEDAAKALMAGLKLPSSEIPETEAYLKILSSLLITTFGARNNNFSEAFCYSQ